MWYKTYVPYNTDVAQMYWYHIFGPVQIHTMLMLHKLVGGVFWSDGVSKLCSCSTNLLALASRIT